MDKGLTVLKWVLIVCPKIPQMSQNLSVQFVCPSPKHLDFNEKLLYWAFVVCALVYQQKTKCNSTKNSRSSQKCAGTVEDGQKKKKFKLLLQHFGEQTQAKRLFFMEKYTSKHV